MGEILFDLYKPFDIFPEQTEEEKARGRLVEVNNGRAAMLGIMAVLSESKGLVVPPLDYIDGFPKYSGDIMVPFEGQFHGAARLHRRLPEVLGRHHGAVRGPVPRERGARRVDRGGPRPLNRPLFERSCARAVPPRGSATSREAKVAARARRFFPFFSCPQGRYAARLARAET